MSLLILQLSDLHIRSDKALLDRADAIARALTGSRPIRRNCLILFSGDIANTGDRQEYLEALRFLAELKRVLVARGTTNLYFAAVPGNHDCDFRRESDTRKFLLDSIEAYLSREIDYSGNNFRALIEVQDNFFTFEQQAALTEDQVEGASRLYYKRRFEIEGKSILIQCLNTAWLSRRHEEQSKLFLPTDLLRESTPASISLSIVMLHHPYNWLNAQNARRTEAFVSLNADLVLTGHEHEADVTLRSHTPDSGIVYFAAPALDDPRASETGFQIADVDFQESVIDVAKFLWRDDMYHEVESQAWPFSRRSQRPLNPFALRNDWLEKLNDIGTGFNHPRCSPPNCRLHLSDLYVYPDLRRSGLDQAIEKDKTSIVHGKDVFDALSASSKAFVSGVETSGKSSLAKMFVKESHRQGRLPVLIAGAALKGKTTEQQILKVLSSAIEGQYNAASSEMFLQADNASKLIVIDDFDDARFSLHQQLNFANRSRAAVS